MKDFRLGYAPAAQRYWGELPTYCLEGRYPLGVPFRVIAQGLPQSWVFHFQRCDPAMRTVVGVDRMTKGDEQGLYGQDSVIDATRLRGTLTINTPDPKIIAADQHACRQQGNDYQQSMQGVQGLGMQGVQGLGMQEMQQHFNSLGQCEARLLGQQAMATSAILPHIARCLR